MSFIIKNLKILARKNKYLEIMAYIIQNNLAKYLNFSGDTLGLDINKKIERSNQVFDSYLKLLNKPASFLEGKSIIEIGTGNNFLIGLHLLSLGAEKVVLLDRFNCLDDESFNQKLYQEFILSLNQNERKALDKKIIIKNDKITFSKNHLQYHPGCSLEEADKVLNEKFDIILSNAVLEHTSNLDKSFKTMKKIIKPNALLVHIVDLKNHLRFQNVHPLYFLTFSDRLWNAMSSNIGSPNRSRFNHYDNLFKKYDLEVLDMIKEKYDFDDKFLLSIRPKLKIKFKDLDDEILKIKSFRVLLKNS